MRHAAGTGRFRARYQRLTDETEYTPADRLRFRACLRHAAGGASATACPWGCLSRRYGRRTGLARRDRRGDWLVRLVGRRGTAGRARRSLDARRVERRRGWCHRRSTRAWNRFLRCVGREWRRDGRPHRLVGQRARALQHAGCRWHNCLTRR
jgi:hypothetical protein